MRPFEQEYVDLKPGTREARERGCICDPSASPGMYLVEGACPVHGIGVLQRILASEEGR